MITSMIDVTTNTPVNAVTHATIRVNTQVTEAANRMTAVMMTSAVVANQEATTTLVGGASLLNQPIIREEGELSTNMELKMKSTRAADQAESIVETRRHLVELVANWLPSQIGYSSMKTRRKLVTSRNRVMDRQLVPYVYTWYIDYKQFSLTIWNRLIFVSNEKASKRN